MKQIVQVNGMTCQGCAKSVQRNFETIQGVQTVQMDLENQSAHLEVEFEISKESLEASLSDTAYEVV